MQLRSTWRRNVRVGIGSLAACLLFCAGVARAADDVAHMWVTSADGKQRLEKLPPIHSNGDAAPGPIVRVDETRAFQPVEGFGASFTESTAWLIQRRMSPAQRRELMRELFDPRKGLGLSLTRVPIGSSDFSLTHHSFDDMPPGQTDPQLAGFSIESARADILPLVKEARRLNPALKVFISPWSAPAWMKTGDSLVKGRLDPRHYDAFARYFDRTLSAFEAEGVPVHAMTVQNEPHFEPPDYPGMRMEPAERAAFIGSHLGPMLAKNWPAVKLLDWDHNWDEPQSPLAVLADPGARPYVAGVAWHCYGGDVSAQSEVHRKYPDIETWMTECSGGGWTPTWSESLLWMTRDLVIGNLRNWGRGANLWNLALDENSGPHLGGCGDCRGVVTIDSRSGAVTRNVEYYVLGHATRFVRPGAYRIESDSGIDGLQTVAIRNAAPGPVVLIVVNTATERRAFSVRTGARAFSATLDAGSVATMTWAPTQATAAQEPPPLRLMTYNIRLDLASDGANAWPHRRDWVAAQIEWLRPDIFGLQEVLPGQKADLIAALPRYRVVGGGRDDGNEKGEASPIGFDVRRFEFLEGGLFWLSPTPTLPSKGWDAAYNRIATWLRLRDHGTRQVILAINTHWDHVGVVARKESAAQIARWIGSNARRCEQVMLFGDFNSEIDSEPIQLLTKGPLALRDARTDSRSAPFGPAGTFNNFELAPAASKTIDHFLLGNRAAVERYLVLAQPIDGRWPSDHFPVLIDVKLAACR
jgi:glucosylceramidase